MSPRASAPRLASTMASARLATSASTPTPRRARFTRSVSAKTPQRAESGCTSSARYTALLAASALTPMRRRQRSRVTPVPAAHRSFMATWGLAPSEPPRSKVTSLAS
ncbi:MAG: hypothetical protein IPN17_38625 [Deltaproteobacteria bacterium]|nr:hypothetical protein [Deltaproteobacteria bacterium]